MKSYRFSFPKTKRNVILKILNKEIDLKEIGYLKLYGHLIRDIVIQKPNINMRAINSIANAIIRKEIDGEILENHEPFTRSWILNNNALIIKNGKITIIRNWAAS